MTSSVFLPGLVGRDYPVQFSYSFNSAAAAQQNEPTTQLTEDSSVGDFIRDILVRIRIHGSVPLTNGSGFGSGSGSGSWYFRQRPSR